MLLLDFSRFFRVVPAKQFLQHFASDRRHMKRPDGSWIKPPPPYTAISTTCEYGIYNEHFKLVYKNYIKILIYQVCVCYNTQICQV